MQTAPAPTAHMLAACRQGITARETKDHVSLLMVKEHVSLLMVKEHVSLLMVKGHVSLLMVKDHVSLLMVKEQVSLLMVRQLGRPRPQHHENCPGPPKNRQNGHLRKPGFKTFLKFPGTSRISSRAEEHSETGNPVCLSKLKFYEYPFFPCLFFYL